MKLEEMVTVYNQGSNVCVIPKSLSQLLDIKSGDVVVISLLDTRLILAKDCSKFQLNLSQQVRVYEQGTSNVVTIPKLMCKLLHIYPKDRLLKSFDFENECIILEKKNDEK